jgi:hypothetical protein
MLDGVEVKPPPCGAKWRPLPIMACSRWRGGLLETYPATCYCTLSDQRNEKKDAPEADVRGTSAEAEQRPAQSERLSQLSESLPEWRIRRSGGGAERFVAPFVTLLRSRTMRLSAGGAASRTHGISPFQKTIGEDQRIRHFLAAVCRRRWPSGRRPQAPQRPSDLRTSATVIFQRQGHKKKISPSPRPTPRDDSANSRDRGCYA